MIEVKEEKILPIYEEIEAIAKKNYAEANFDNYFGIMELDKEKFCALQEQGNLVFFAFRKSGKLVGYSFYLLMQSLFGNALIAENWAFYLVPEERKGFTANNLLKEVEKLLAEKNVNLLMHRTRTDMDLSAFFERAGFKFQEKVYVKKIGVEI